MAYVADPRQQRIEARMELKCELDAAAQLARELAGALRAASAATVTLNRIESEHAKAA